MLHETNLIATIVMGLVLAFGLGFLANRLRLPPLVGYLLAGVVVGPFTPGYVADASLAGQLAEIGVILLMFGVGLHFSIRDLMAVRWIAVPGALAQMVTAVGACVGLAALWSWNLGAGVLLGLALSVASTVVLLRVLEDRCALSSDDGRIAVGWLIVQDLAMVLALVLLPALADQLGGDSRGLAGHVGGDSVALTLAVTLGKLALFVALVLVVGKQVVPWLLAQAARTGSRELFTLSVLAVSLGIAYGSAELFGVSFALGAFFAGVVLSESDLSHQAAADSLPLQDAFAVLFFVSVGMLFDPWILMQEPLRVITVLIVIVLVKSLTAAAVLLALRQSVATSLTVSAGLAQIGEFSFILASLGLALGLLPKEGQDLILAGALLSITLNPLVFAAVNPLVSWFQKQPKIRSRLERSGGDRLVSVPDGDDSLHDHGVIVGYGRVGRKICRVFDAWELPYVVVEKDWHRAEALRARGLKVIYGDASAPGILAAAGVDRARLLIIASPDGYQARRILEIAREANPEIDTVVRTHSEAELAHLESEGVGIAVQAEQELALGMLGYALRSMGLSESEARMFVQSARKYDDAGMLQETPPHDSAPELRPHRVSDGGQTG
ncbi:MAG: Kef family K(+) transporter [Pseudomonadota bacterium]|nr:Kef family K(+) transporter [Pseudomonadota bacterium]